MTAIKPSNLLEPSNFTLMFHLSPNPHMVHTNETLKEE